MGLSSLDTALSGLRISQRQIEIISSNVANVGTEGYTRKILPQSTRVIEGESIGVRQGIVVRNVDLRLERDLWTQISSVNNFDIQSSYLSRVDQFHGAPSANISVAAEVSKLQDTFAALANSPDDQFLITDVVDQAQDTAKKINNLSTFYTTLRNDAQNEAEIVIQSINDLLDQIAELNGNIKFDNISGRTIAATEDIRDQAIQDLSKLMDISIFSKGSGVLVVQTLEGVELASERAVKLSFSPSPLSAISSRPNTSAGIFVGDPILAPNAIEITDAKLGGKLGGLITLRDQTFPKQMAQLDELAHKMALRFEAQGLRLFTDVSGSIPVDTPPDSTVDPVVPVTYIGFSADIQVNSLIINDHTLLQTGTYGGTLQGGANDVMRRIIEFTFGEVDYQMAANSDAATSVDIRSAATGATTLQNWLGVAPTNRITSGISLGNYASVADIVTAGGTAVFGSGATETDSLTLRFDDPDIGGGPYDITIDLRTVAATGTSAAQDLVDHINADPNMALALADFGSNVSVGTNGELVINSSSDIEILNSPLEPLSTLGYSFLGLSPSTSEAQDPYFDVTVGNNAAVRITIAPNDTEVELLAKLNAVTGLAAQIDADGFLSMRPGDSFSNPDFGGDIAVIGGPFTTNNATLAGTAAGRGSIDNDVNIAQALFGTYQVIAPGVIEGNSPLIDISYQSETEVGSGAYVAFRSALLGSNTAVKTEISSSITLKDYSQKIINEVAQEIALLNSRSTDERSLQNLLQQQLLNETGVNIDGELSHLIVVQTAYSASARVINAIDEIFQELLNLL